jgi:epoxyqueuosine reductase
VLSESIPEKNTIALKKIASALGFDFCGISKAAFLEKEARDLETWLKLGFHGEMGYLERNFDKRLDPRLLVPGAKSVVSLLYNYFPGSAYPDDNPYKISRYALGEDYHIVLKDKLKALFSAITVKIGKVEGRVFVDSAPVMEKSWAAKAGLGWIGKNVNLINKNFGSYFFLAEVILDLDLVPDGPIKDYCGTCTRCIDACPTDALFEPYKIDATRCISYLTIELQGEIQDRFHDQMDGWVFGCDICQEVCPWNRFSKPHQEPRFVLSSSIAEWMNEGFPEAEGVFRELAKNSPLKRAGLQKLKQVAAIIQKTKTRRVSG